MTDYKEIIGDYSPYMDNYGLVQSGPIDKYGKVGTSQNGLRFTAEYCYALWKNKVYTDMDRILHVVYTCMDKPGLCKRDPTGEHTSIDDYCGVALMAHLIEPKLAQEILDFGKKHQGFYGIGLKYWLWRFPALFGALRISAGLLPNFMQKWWFIFSCLFSDKQQDSFAILWSLSKVYEGQSVIIDWAIRYRRHVFRQTYPGGYGEMFSEYSQNTTHPHVKYLKGDF